MTRIHACIPTPNAPIFCGSGFPSAGWQVQYSGNERKYSQTNLRQTTPAILLEHGTVILHKPFRDLVRRNEYSEVGAFGSSHTSTELRSSSVPLLMGCNVSKSITKFLAPASSAFCNNSLKTSLKSVAQQNPT